MATGIFTSSTTNLESLLQLARRAHSLDERVQWIDDLVSWVRIPVSNEEIKSRTEQINSARLRFLLNTLEKNPERKAEVARILSSVLLETDWRGLFIQTGLHRERGVTAEFTERVMQKLVARPLNSNDFSDLIERIFSQEVDARWIRELSPSVSMKLAELLTPDENIEAFLREKAERTGLEALLFLFSQINANAMQIAFRMGLVQNDLARLPFYRLLVAGQDVFLQGKISTEDQKRLMRLHEECRLAQTRFTAYLEEFGVSLSLVYQLELIEKLLYRSRLIIQLLAREEQSNLVWRDFVGELVENKFEQMSLRNLLRSNFHLVSRKITERAGESGEHYITKTRAEYGEMMISAAGGGVVTAFTAVIKFFLSNLKMSPFFEGFFFSLNYAGSFVLMQMMHLTLATKQPSVTAPALAAKLKNNPGDQQFEEFVDTVVRVSRSQFAAFLGNIGLVIPTAIMFDLFWVVTYKHHLFPADYALKTMKNFHPLMSMSLPLAAFTGVLLWLASVTAGWVENWFVYRKIPQSIVRSVRLRKLFGIKRVERLASFFSQNISATAGNVSLGCYLGFTVAAGRFIGLPIDVRHVTLSAGALTLAACSLIGNNMNWALFSAAAIGVLLIGALNFLVSFTLALMVALRASEVEGAHLKFLRHLILSRLRKTPLDFFRPPKDAETKIL